MSNQLVQLGYQLRVATELEVGLDALLNRHQAQLFEPGDRRLCERLVGEVLQGVAAPESKTFSQERGGHLGVFRRRLLDEALEAKRIDSLWLDTQRVATVAGFDQTGARPGGSLGLE